ncbi:hypothetical protein GCM10010435_64290 [Winogradskya consettensis]|uniref:Uncharacterized protein n=1 Tax=Winogradskya consettensis TaxID=113560 RepID=A0A919VQA2_9ACTN|nr:hypothetical protein Aco04nite_29670 [Actinoplanes consettensis]
MEFGEKGVAHADSEHAEQHGGEDGMRTTGDGGHCCAAGQQGEATYGPDPGATSLLHIQ